MEIEVVTEIVESVEGDIPSNMTISWSRGDKSFVEILERRLENGYPRGANNRLLWLEAPKGEQLNEAECDCAFIGARYYAKTNPTRAVHFVRYDNADIVEENDNNASYKRVNGQMVKVTESYLVANDFVDSNTGWWRNY